MSLAPNLHGEEVNENALLSALSQVEINGFIEARGGYRTQDDLYEKDESVMEARFQAELYTCTDWAEFKYKGDVWADGITESGEYEARETWIFLRPTGFMDVKAGRQVLTWGTGDLVFVNDLFPKDWQSYFIGRDKEYLKAPSDALKLSFFTSIASVDLVYTPQFDSDRFITGEYISYWNAHENKRSGQDAIVHAHTPDQWFEDDELALRVYRNINNYEFAFYGYDGFWKRPAGQDYSGVPIFPRLSVYGASIRGQAGHGIGNIEVAYYHSKDDANGSDPLIDNSEMRYLIGYSQDLARDFNASLQYYVESMMDYDDYRANMTQGQARDENRQVITLLLTKLMMNQNLKLSLSSYYSPSDRDAYLRPKIGYNYTDNITMEMGANYFIGDEPHTFFGQFEKNSNVYTAVKYSF